MYCSKLQFVFHISKKDDFLGRIKRAHGILKNVATLSVKVEMCYISKSFSTRSVENNVRNVQHFRFNFKTFHGNVRDKAYNFFALKKKIKYILLNNYIYFIEYSFIISWYFYKFIFF